MAEWIRSGQNAVLVPTENVAGLAAAMASLMEDPARRQFLGRSAAESVRQFDVERIVDRWEELLS